MGLESSTSSSSREEVEIFTTRTMWRRSVSKKKKEPACDLLRKAAGIWQTEVYLHHATRGL
jgi:hypothetical protein